MNFHALFSTIVIATALLVAAFLLHSQRPAGQVHQPNASFVRATGKCAECHRRETSAVLHEFEMSVHAARDVNCLDCHRPLAGQESMPHRGFEIARHLTAANCRQCHATEYRQYERSRHAAPAWAAVSGPKDFTPEQIAFAEQFHQGAVKRDANALAEIEGPAAINRGCYQCHDIGRPNPDGSIGTCTACHARHAASVELARTPETCGQCHMGPDHSQIEIYDESKHGVMFAAQEHLLKLDADPRTLTTHDMFVPTCATCHMSGINGLKVTHDPSERLSWYLANAVSEKRPNYLRAQANMKQVCAQCHTQTLVDRVYAQAEDVVANTNAKVLAAKAIVDGLHKEGVVSGPPFSNPIDFTYFDLWHYDGRTSKHGAFMGGADFVQWHGNYGLLQKTIQLQHDAAELRRAHGAR